MSEHRAKVSWQRQTESFAYKDYDREHVWDFGDGKTIEASAAEDFLGKAGFVDPEQAFVASLASCHMLTFLAICAKKRLTVDSYVDNASGRLEKRGDGKLVITRVDLYPKIRFAAGVEVSGEKLHDIHELSHKECFLANSVTCEIVTHRV